MLGYRRGYARGVGDHAAFGHARGRGQGHGAGVEGIGHGRDRGGRADVQLLEVTAGGAGDAHADVAGIHVYGVLWCVDGDGAFALALGNGDHRAVAQVDCHGAAGRVAQLDGIGDLAAFLNGTGSAQADIGGVQVARVIDDRGTWGTGGDQFLVVAAGDAGDAVGQRCIGGVDIVRRNKVYRATGLVDLDDDALTVGERNHQRRAGYRRCHGCRVGHHATFADAWGGCQGDRAGVDRIDYRCFR